MKSPESSPILYRVPEEKPKRQLGPKAKEAAIYAGGAGIVFALLFGGFKGVETVVTAIENIQAQAQQQQALDTQQRLDKDYKRSQEVLDQMGLSGEKSIIGAPKIVTLKKGDNTYQMVSFAWEDKTKGDQAYLASMFPNQITFKVSDSPDQKPQVKFGFNLYDLGYNVDTGMGWSDYSNPNNIVENFATSAIITLNQSDFNSMQTGN